jgi:peroxiredoxin
LISYKLGENNIVILQIRRLCLIILSSVCIFAVTATAGEVPADIVFDFELPLPQSSEDNAYLGAGDGRGTFLPGQVKARVLLIQIFSMYCPICQREAAVTNQLFKAIRSDKDMSRQIKMIGIGAGNSDFEVAFFKSTYGIEFPLFSDPKFIIHRKVSEVGTPHFFGLRLNRELPELVFSHSGPIKDPDLFLSRLKKASGPGEFHE